MSAYRVCRTDDLVALDDALNALARVDSRKVRVVELPFFGGLSIEETAAVLNASPITVRRDCEQRQGLAVSRTGR